jgi:hypothetical protein
VITAVFLTKNGHERYAVLDIDPHKEYEKRIITNNQNITVRKFEGAGEFTRSLAFSYPADADFEL